MKKQLQNQDGFGVVESLLVIIIVLLVGFIGYYVYHNQNATDDSATKLTAATKTAATTPQLSDEEQIVAAVKAYTGAGDQSSATVTVRDIVGDNAQGSVGGSEGGAAFIAHKANGSWQVVFEGQEAAGSDIGQKYNLPADWYTTDYR